MSHQFVPGLGSHAKYGYVVKMNLAAKLEFPPQGLDSEQLRFIRCWLNELGGPHRKEANVLIRLLMAGIITDEEACNALDRLNV